MKLYNTSVFHKIGIGLALVGIFSFGAVIAQKAPATCHASAAQIRVADSGQETHGKNDPGGKGGRRFA